MITLTWIVCYLYLCFFLTEYSFYSNATSIYIFVQSSKPSTSVSTSTLNPLWRSPEDWKYIFNHEVVQSVPLNTDLALDVKYLVAHGGLLLRDPQLVPVT